MKKILIFLTIIVCLLSSCIMNKKAEKPEPTDEQLASIDVFNDNISKVDYDLSLMSATMVYSQVFDMVSNPKKYYGKRFRIKGLYARNHYDVTNLDYHFVVISDATACCAQGIEFVWNGNHSIEEYPQENDDIILCGVFSSYVELDTIYSCLFIG